MSSLLIFGDPDQFRPSRLATAWKEAGGDVYIYCSKEIAISYPFSAKELLAKTDLSSIDAVVVFDNLQRGDLHGVSQLIQEAFQCPILFSAQHKQRLGEHSPIVRYQKMVDADISLPETMIFGSNAQESILTHWNIYPCVFKRSRSSGKRAVGLAHTKEELKQLWERYYQKNALYYLKQYIPHEREWRIVLVDGVPVSALERTGPTKAFLAAFREGAVRKNRPLKEIPHVTKLAKQVHDIYQEDVLGIDIIESETGELYVLDVNTNPIYRMSEQVTGVNIASSIVELIERRIKHSKNTV